MKNFTSLIQNFFRAKCAIVMAIAFMLSTSASAQLTVVDFQAPNTSFVFNYFANGAVGGVTGIIPNPDPTGINTSSTVGEFVKGANGEFFAGAVTNLAAGPPPPVSMDFTVYSEACMTVWFPAPGNVLLKCEGAVIGGGTWEQLQQVTTTNAWTQICFDGTLPDQGGGNSGPAIGRKFNVLVLFFDFGNVYQANRTYYFDDLFLQGSAPPRK